MNSNNIICDEIEEILRNGLKKLSDAIHNHIPFCKSKNDNYMKYIPERCFTTYFAYSLISNDFNVFNEQEYYSEELKKLDLLAMRFSDNSDERIQIKVEAKGNLDGCYKQIYDDIDRMQRLSMRYDTTEFFNENKHDDYFIHKFSIIITSNWSFKELTKWWTDNNDIPERVKGGLRKDENGWKKLKDKINEAQTRNTINMINNIDALYAIFLN